MKISIIGTGYVGLVSSIGLAENGHQVWSMDTNESKIHFLQRGISPIYEKGLDKYLKKNLEKKTLSFTTSFEKAINNSKFIFIAVGTPMKLDTEEADISSVLDVAKKIGQTINENKIIIVKSTVPMGTCEQTKSIVQEELDKRGKNISFEIVSNPEFLREGCAIYDFLEPDRIIVGTDSEKGKQLMEELYLPWSRKGYPVIFMDLASSEMSKYASNALLATKISFINEISKLCEKTSANIDNIKKALGSDPRISPHFLNSGLGYGGCCFPKDVKALYKIAEQYDMEMNILKATDKTNQEQRKFFINKILRKYNDVNGKKFSLWGLAFKPGTDDIREAPSIDIIKCLTEKGAKIVAHDPEAMNNCSAFFKNNMNLSFADNYYDTLNDCDALIIATEWESYKEADFHKIYKLLKNPVIFDGRNIHDPQRLEDLNFEYFSIGR